MRSILDYYVTAHSIDHRGSSAGVFFGNLPTTTDGLVEEGHEINSYNIMGRRVSTSAN